MIDDAFGLSDGERMHPLWMRLEQHFRRRLDELRKQNDGPLDEVRTAHLRGRIAEVGALLDLAEPLPRLG